MTKQERIDSLIPLGVPRYIRIWDNGGSEKENGTFDRYTVVFHKKSFRDDRGAYFMYIGMSENPFHPQGFGQHGEIEDPKGGRHLGKRIKFDQLPPDCQSLVLSDYKELWGLKQEAK